MGFAVCCHNVPVNVDCTKALSLPVKRLLDACNASVALVHSMCPHRYGACKFHHAAGAAEAQMSHDSCFDVRCLAYAHNAVCMPSIHVMTCMSCRRPSQSASTTGIRVRQDRKQRGGCSHGDY